MRRKASSSMGLPEKPAKKKPPLDPWLWDRCLPKKLWPKGS